MDTRKFDEKYKEYLELINNSGIVRKFGDIANWWISFDKDEFRYTFKHDIRKSFVFTRTNTFTGNERNITEKTFLKHLKLSLENQLRCEGYDREHGLL